ncbi:unnamed protein product [Brachionus calyciflorus]|uniref:Uncharacterized protein n=1 Tax=Brachionus calyciflorus TaxID=104777 RepID=A0A813MLL3_9BILA|nr:unnamed protein product [Brachionus calyciflorus]
MKLLKKELIEYFDELKNEIDINCEKKLCIDSSEAERLKIEKIRSNYLYQVNRIYANNLQKYEIVKELDYEQINFDDWEFCFLIPSDNEIGFLILINHYISKELQLYLRSPDFSERNQYYKKLTNRDLILACLLNNILSEKFSLFRYKSIDLNIIDLRDPKQNIIKSFRLGDAGLFSIKSKDLYLIDSLIDKTHLTRWYLELSKTILEENFFSNFENILTLDIKSEKSSYLKPNCLNGLHNLKFLKIFWNASILEENIFSNLENLTEIHFRESLIRVLGENAFKNLPKVNTIDICGSRIEEIASNSFSDLNSLEYLNLAKNFITSLPDNVFNGLKNLTALNLNNCLVVEIEAKFFNNLENLEFLAINQNKKPGKVSNLDGLKLPKLKFLDINSRKVPKFDLSLEILVIDGLEQFKENMFDRLSSLQILVICLDEKFLNEIKKEFFENMDKLAHVVFKFDRLNIESIDFIKNNYDYYKAFLKKPNANLDLIISLRQFKISCFPRNHAVEFIKSEMKVNQITKSVICKDIDGYAKLLN